MTKIKIVSSSQNVSISYVCGVMKNVTCILNTLYLDRNYFSKINTKHVILYLSRLDKI